jgi:CBS domain-containing protein
MKTVESIVQIMASNVVTISIKDSLFKAKDIFEKHKIRHIPVVDEKNQLVGMLSLTDIQRISIGGAFGGDPEMVNQAIFEMLSIEQVMKKNLHTVQLNQSVKEVAQILTTGEFHALPVLEGEKLIGIVTTTDVIRYLLEKCEVGTEAAIGLKNISAVL